MRVHNCLSSPANLLLILSVLTKLKLFLQCSGIYSLYRMFICVYFYRKQFLQLLWENDHDGIRVPFPNCFLSKILQLQLQKVLGFSLSGQYLFSNEPGDVWNPNSWNILLESLRKVMFLVSVSTGCILWKAQQSIWWTALLRWSGGNRMFTPLITLYFPKMLIRIYFISSAS